jgi:hypothetical protein
MRGSEGDAFQRVAAERRLLDRRADLALARLEGAAMTASGLVVPPPAPIIWSMSRNAVCSDRSRRGSSPQAA